LARVTDIGVVGPTREKQRLKHQGLSFLNNQATAPGVMPLIGKPNPIMLVATVVVRKKIVQPSSLLFAIIPNRTMNPETIAAKLIATWTIVKAGRAESWDEYLSDSDREFAAAEYGGGLLNHASNQFHDGTSVVHRACRFSTRNL
jgi:hypothetical protein